MIFKLNNSLSPSSVVPRILLVLLLQIFFLRFQVLTVSKRSTQKLTNRIQTRVL